MKLSMVLTAMVLILPFHAWSDEPVTDEKTDAGVAAMGLCNDCLTPMFNDRIDANRANSLRIINAVMDPNVALPALDSSKTDR